MTDESNHLLDLFTAALELTVEERAAFLGRECSGDSNLQGKLDCLLRLQQRTGDFLERSPAAQTAGAMRGDPVGEKLGDQIGQYKLLKQIGEGGCGVVFMAEQAEPVRRTVALKIVKPGMDTKSVIARFEAERQMLALMDHPSIAKVFDAGATTSGRPYFVMELVRGVKITEYCDQRSLSTGERLGLFAEICHAVQHAHQKGIIHRDIKPSNILVTTSSDGKALPVVIDFGIAKATANHRLTDKTLFTSFEMLIGTPTYMSPEQTALTSVDVDTRTDIYSLGVLLYELVTGSTPFDGESLVDAGLDEIRRVVREEDPDRPSTRLRAMTAHDLTLVSRHRNSEALKLIRTVCGDLDWITMKALEKDRARRYETANALALDVRRYLTDEPVSARPPSKTYRLRKLLLRNKLLFTGIGVISVLLVASLIVVTTSFARERRARQDADGDKQKAQQVTNFLKDMLQGVGPSVALGQDTTMLQAILDRTAERVGSEMTDQPVVEADLRNLIGTVYRRLGNYARAEDMHREALAIRRRHFGSMSLEAAESLNDLGVELRAGHKLSEAESVVTEALAIRRQLLGNDNADTAASLNDLGAVYRDQGKLKEAEVLAKEALGIRRRLFGEEHLEVADSLRNLCIVVGTDGRWSEAEALARQVLAMQRNLLGAEHPWVASALADLAWAAGGGGKLEEAEALERETLAMRQKLLPESHPDVAKSLYLVGDRMRQQGDLSEASSLLGAALSIQRKLLGDDSPALLDTLSSLASALEAEGKMTESEEVHHEAHTLRVNVGEDGTPKALSQLEGYARVLVAQRKFGDAERLLDDALVPRIAGQQASAPLLAIRSELKARSGQWKEAASDAALLFELKPHNSGNYSVLAALLAMTRDQSQYEQFCGKLLEMHADTTDRWIADQVAKSCLFLPSPAISLEVVRHLVDVAVTQGVDDQGAMPYHQVSKALCEYRIGHFAEAADWARRPLEVPGIHAHEQAYAVLALAHWRLGEKDKAREMLEKGNALAPSAMPERIAEDRGNAWLAWLFARIQLNEATALIVPGTSSE